MNSVLLMARVLLRYSGYRRTAHIKQSIGIFNFLFCMESIRSFLERELRIIRRHRNIKVQNTTFIGEVQILCNASMGTSVVGEGSLVTKGLPSNTLVWEERQSSLKPFWLRRAGEIVILHRFLEPAGESGGSPCCKAGRLWEDGSFKSFQVKHVKGNEKS